MIEPFDFMNHLPLEIMVQSCPAPKFKALTYPRFQSLLTDEEPEDAHKERLVVGAMCQGVPVGLALFGRPYGDGERRLLSVFVSHKFRRQGIGLKLLAEGERAALGVGTKKLVAFHSSQIPNYTVYESLMQKAGWSAPELLEYRLAGKAKWVYEAERDWEKFLVRVKRGGFITTYWPDLTDADREQIAHVMENDVPEEDQVYNPLKHNLPEFLPEISALLRCGNEIAGWVLGSKSANDHTYYYTNGYALPKYQKRGYLIVGMMEVCRRQAELFGPETLSTYETRNAAMKRVMHQQIKPYSEWTDERFVCEKILMDTGEKLEV